MEFKISPTIVEFDNKEKFLNYVNFDENDVILTNRYIFDPFFGALAIPSLKIFLEDFGQSEPTDEMITLIKTKLPKKMNRLFTIGGGSVIDVGKFLSLSFEGTVAELVDGRIPFEKSCPVIAVPTTCGTGSEVTNVAVTAISKRNIKKGLASDFLFPEKAILFPELLDFLPYKFFATSSIDALIHGIEAYLSGFATYFSSMFAKEAICLILSSYREVSKKGKDSWKDRRMTFLRASTMAGLAFGNSGTATVHALSYPLSGRYHIPHGEANQLMLMSVLKFYQQEEPNGKLKNLRELIASSLETSEEQAFQELESLLNGIHKRKTLAEYGIETSEYLSLASQVFEEQQRLLKHSYIPMTIASLEKCYWES